MKLKVGHVLNMMSRMTDRGRSAIQILGNSDLSVETSYEVVKISDALERVANRYNEIVGRLNEKHREQGEDGSWSAISPEDGEIFEEKLGDLLNYEVDIDASPISIDSLEGCRIKPSVLANLAPIIDGYENGQDDDGDPLEGYEV